MEQSVIGRTAATPGLRVTSVAALMIFGLLAALPIVRAGEAQLIEFEIEDQFDEVHRDDDFEGRVIVMIGSDKGGAEFNRIWGEAIRDSLALDGLEHDYARLAVADVRGVPFFLKGMVKGKFPEDPEEWALVDWNGKIAQAYAFEPDASNILIFDRDGALIHQVSGREPDPEKLRTMIELLRALLGSDGRGESE